MTYVDILGIDPIYPTHVHKTILSDPSGPRLVAQRFSRTPLVVHGSRMGQTFPTESRYVLSLRGGGDSAAADLAMRDRLGRYMVVRAALGK